MPEQAMARLGDGKGSSWWVLGPTCKQLDRVRESGTRGGVHELQAVGGAAHAKQLKDACQPQHAQYREDRHARLRRARNACDESKAGCNVSWAARRQPGAAWGARQGVGARVQAQARAAAARTSVESAAALMMIFR